MIEELQIENIQEESNVIDDRLLLYGDKDILLISNDSIFNEIKEDNREFINK